MSSSFTHTIPSERNLPLVIQFTRTSPTFTPPARLSALRSLVHRITLARASALEARRVAACTLEQGDRYTAQLNDMRGVPEDVMGAFRGMTGRVVGEKLGEMREIEREIGALEGCLREAERGVVEAERACRGG